MARWTNQTFDYVKSLSEQFKKNVGGIAQAIAEHEDAEYVLRRHVGEAFETLSRTGLNRRPLLKRPESAVAAGMAMFGAAAAFPDLCNGLFPDPDTTKNIFITGAMIVFIGAGIALVAIGFLRGSGRF